MRGRSDNKSHQNLIVCHKTRHEGSVPQSPNGIPVDPITSQSLSKHAIHQLLDSLPTSQPVQTTELELQQRSNRCCPIVVVVLLLDKAESRVQTVCERAGEGQVGETTDEARKVEEGWGGWWRGGFRRVRREREKVGDGR
jgi:hypothetical protein